MIECSAGSRFTTRKKTLSSRPYPRWRGIWRFSRAWWKWCVMRPKKNGEKRISGIVFSLLAEGFWSSTMQGVRRLVEIGPIEGPKGICSLGALIDDVRASRSKLTREVFVRDIAGLAYNYRAIQRQAEEYAHQQIANGIRSYWVPRELHHELSAQRHVLFDWLSGTEPGASCPNDVIREEVFNLLSAKLAGLANVLGHVNVDIAHAATEASREGRVLEKWGVPEARLALQQIAEVAEVVGNWFCFSGIGTVLPHPQFDQFAHIGAPLFDGDVTRLQAIWDDFEREAGQWHRVDPRNW